MLNKFSQKRNVFLFVGIIISIVLWILTLIYGNSEDKIRLIIMSLILPIIVYGFVRLMFKLIRINAPLGFIKLAIWFYLIFGILGMFINLINFIIGFPNGFSLTFTLCLSLVTGVFDEAKKNI